VNACAILPKITKWLRVAGLLVVFALHCGDGTRPRFKPPSIHLRTMPAKSGGVAVDSRGMDSVMAAVGDLEKILEELPPDYLPQFEEAAQEMMSAFKSRAEPELPSSPEPAEEESAGKERDTKRRKKADKSNPFQQMKDIQHWLRLKVPAEAVVPSEAIIYGHEGTDFADYTATNTQSVDGFLYEEDDIDELCEAGKLARSYCTSCGSRNIKDLNFISHSFSIRELEFVFKDALRGVLLEVLGLGLDKCCVVDVGSRLGSVLYAACVFGNVNEAIGIEMNSDLCKVGKNTSAYVRIRIRQHNTSAYVSTRQRRSASL
jgi:hypothetical protein